MDGHRFYIQQITFNGIAYTKGEFADSLDDFGIACKEWPFKLYPEAKDVAETDYTDEHGKDAYIPSHAVLKDYDIESEFIVNGTSLSDVQTKIKTFFDFLYGFNSGGSARLAAYDEHTGIGRKDIRLVEVDNDLWWNDDSDDEKIAIFKVKFHVYDPKTDVQLSNNNDELVW